MALDTEKILFQLAIKGVPPSEIDAAARQTGDQLLSAMRAQYEKLRRLHQAAEQAQLADTVKAVEGRIKEEEKALASLERIRRASEVAANAHRNAFFRALEVGENVVTVMEGMGHAIEAGWHKFKELSEEIIRTTQVYGALKGTIDDLRAGTRGEVADMDLILAKNRAFQKDLALTDEEWAAVGERAKIYADALGTDVKDALDQVIDGLATGKLKTLEHAGVVLDARSAQIEYAKSIGKTVDQLNDEEKKHAVTEAALRKMTKTAGEAAGEQENLANTLERAFATASNAWDQFVLSLSHSGVLQDILKGAGDLLRDAKIIIDRYNEWKGDVGPKTDLGKQYMNAFGVGPTPGEGDVSFEDDDVEKIYGEIRKKKKGGGGAKASAWAIAAAIYARKQGMRELFDKYQGPEKDYSAEVGGIDEGPGGRASDAELDRLMKSGPEGGKSDIEEQLDALAKRVEDKFSKSGLHKGGILSTAIFGDEGSEGWLENLGSTSQATLDSLGMIQDAGEAMAGAMGQAWADLLSGEKQRSLAENTRQILKGLSAQASTRAVMELAEGLASSFLNPPAAATHFAAAAMFATVGTWAGLGAGAIGPPSAGGSGATSRRGGELGHGTGGSRRSSSGSQGAESVVINIGSVWPGGEAEAGRQVQKALDAWYAKKGRPN